MIISRLDEIAERPMDIAGTEQALSDLCAHHTRPWSYKENRMVRSADARPLEADGNASCPPASWLADHTPLGCRALQPLPIPLSRKFRPSSNVRWCCRGGTSRPGWRGRRAHPDNPPPACVDHGKRLGATALLPARWAASLAPEMTCGKGRVRPSGVTTRMRARYPLG